MNDTDYVQTLLETEITGDPYVDSTLYEMLGEVIADSKYLSLDRVRAYLMMESIPRVTWDVRERCTSYITVFEAECCIDPDPPPEFCGDMDIEPSVMNDHEGWEEM